MRRLGLVVLLVGAALVGCRDDARPVPDGARPTPTPGKPVVVGKFDRPFLARGVAVDGKGTVYASDWDGKQWALVAYPRQGKPTRRAIPCATDAQGPYYNAFTSLTAAPDGTLYWSLSLLFRVVRIHPDGQGECVAGTGKLGYSGDGGPAGAAELGEIRSLAFDAERGDLYLTDLTAKVVRKVDRSGTITTVVPRGGLTGTAPDPGAPWIAFDSRRGLLYGREAGGIAVRDRDGNVRVLPGTDSKALPLPGVNDAPLSGLAPTPDGLVVTSRLLPCQVVLAGPGGVRPVDTGRLLNGLGLTDCPKQVAVDADGTIWAVTDREVIGIAPPG